MTPGPIRFTDILTTATTIATQLGEPTIDAVHLLKAIDLVAGTRTPEDLGRPVSPLIPRPRRGPDVSPPVRELVQRWWSKLGEDPMAILADTDRDRLQAELEHLSHKP